MWDVSGVQDNLVTLDAKSKVFVASTHDKPN